MRRGRVVGAVAVAVALLAVGACSGDAGSADRASTTAARTTATTTTTAPAGVRLPPSTVAAPADAAITQPAQPRTGFGGSTVAHRTWRETAGGSGADAWYVFEPTGPTPKRAPVAVILHGYYEYSGHSTMDTLIQHTVQTGSIVIYPRWQVGLADPCPGPYDIGGCLRSATTAITDALAFLRADQGRVQPDTDRASYFGFSFGGIIATDLANRYQDLGLPRPRAIFLDDPHDGGLDGAGEPAVDRPLDGIPADVLFECHSGAHGVVSEAGKARSSCNAIFPRLTRIPPRNKRLVMTHDDAHGRPALRSTHGVCAGHEGEADAYDWGFCWKVWDALRSAADGGPGRAVALGRGRGAASIGRWSDGTPISPLEIATQAPVSP